MGKKMKSAAWFTARYGAATAAGVLAALFYVELRELYRWLEEQKLDEGLGVMGG